MATWALRPAILTECGVEAGRYPQRLSANGPCGRKTLPHAELKRINPAKCSMIDDLPDLHFTSGIQAVYRHYTRLSSLCTTRQVPVTAGISTDTTEPPFWSYPFWLNLSRSRAGTQTSVCKGRLKAVKTCAPITTRSPNIYKSAELSPSASV
jgi:hypothetical protein